MAPVQRPIDYVKSQINGITVRPDSQSVVKQAIAGRRIDVYSSNDYINLYHVFERLQARNQKLAEYEMIRQQIGPNHWALFIAPSKKDAPKVALEKNYDPVRGRYKRYAAQLAGGQTLTFTGKVEARKARRAWQLYVSRAKRVGLKAKATKRGQEIDLVIVNGS